MPTVGLTPNQRGPVGISTARYSSCATARAAASGRLASVAGVAKAEAVTKIAARVSSPAPMLASYGSEAVGYGPPGGAQAARSGRSKAQARSWRIGGDFPTVVRPAYLGPPGVKRNCRF